MIETKGSKVLREALKKNVLPSNYYNETCEIRSYDLIFNFTIPANGRVEKEISGRDLWTFIMTGRRAVVSPKTLTHSLNAKIIQLEKSDGVSSSSDNKGFVSLDTAFGLSIPYYQEDFDRFKNCGERPYFRCEVHNPNNEEVQASIMLIGWEVYSNAN